MTDFDYENKQKKDIARGARYKKNGSKSRRCTFPSDHLTPAQKAALNGPVTTILLNQPMSWMTFNSPAMTDTLKVEYIKNLQDTYRASNQMLSKMFGVCASTVGLELRRLNLRPLRGTQGRTPEKTRILHAWDAFCNGVVGGGDDPNLVKPEANEQIEPANDKVDQPQVTCWDVDSEKLADALEEAKRIAEEQEPTGFADAVKKHNEKPQWDLDSPDHVNAYRVKETEDEVVEEPDPITELMQAFEKGFDSEDKPAKDMIPAKLSKMQVNLSGYYESVSEQIDALLKAFGEQVRVRMEIVAE